MASVTEKKGKLKTTWAELTEISRSKIQHHCYINFFQGIKFVWYTMSDIIPVRQGFLNSQQSLPLHLIVQVLLWQKCLPVFKINIYIYNITIYINFVDAKSSECFYIYSCMCHFVNKLMCMDMHIYTIVTCQLKSPAAALCSLVQRFSGPESQKPSSSAKLFRKVIVSERPSVSPWRISKSSTNLKNKLGGKKSVKLEKACHRFYYWNRSLFKNINLTNSPGSFSRLFGTWAIHHGHQVHFQHLHTTQEWKYLVQAPFVVDTQELWHHATFLPH